MNRKYTIIIAVVICIALIAFLVMWGSGKPVAVVNGQPISEEELQTAIASREMLHAGTGATVSPEALRASVLEQLISEALVLQGTQEAGITISDEELAAELDSIKKRSGVEAFGKYLKSNSLTEQEYSARLRERMIKDRFVNEVIFTGEISEEDLKDFYKDSPMPFMAPESVELRIVEFATQEAADAAMRAMKKRGFDKVAESLRKDSTAFVSDYGETTPAYYPGEVGRAMKELPEGEFGGPYMGKDGFFVIRIKKRTPERPRTFEEARDEIRSILRERRKSAAIIHWVADRKNTSTIVRN